MPDSSTQNDNLVSFADFQRDRWQPENLDGLVRQLESVDQLTEQVFLDLGARIRMFYTRGRQIAESANSSVALLQGEDTDNTLPRLQLVVERCGLWLTENQARSADICQLLSDVDKQLDALEMPLFMLRKVIKTLHSLRVTTRIEASKASGLGAGVLADALHQISDMIQEKVEEISGLLENLGMLNQTALTAETVISGSFLRGAREEVDAVRKELSQFSGARMVISDWSRRLKGRSEEIAASFGELVAALQFQDITRQRLEHIQSTLKDLQLRLMEMDLSAGLSSDRELAGVVGNICLLQHEQLQLSGNEFSEAVGQLTLNLQGMAESVVSLADDTLGLSQATDSGDVGQVSQVMEMLESITQRLETAQVTHGEAHQALVDVCRAVEGVSGLVDDVEYIGEEMQLLAINAAISAAHARSRGAGLEIISQNIQDLSVEASDQAAILAQECGKISSHAETLNTLEEGEGGGVNALLQESRALLTELDNNTGKLDDVASAINHDAKQLSADLLAVVREMDVQARFAENIQPVLGQLADMGGWAGTTAVGSHVTLEELLVKLQQRYTMSSERDVHRQFVDSQSERGAAADQEVSDEPAQDHNLGDNVILF